MTHITVGTGGRKLSGVEHDQPEWLEYAERWVGMGTCGSGVGWWWGSHRGCTGGRQAGWGSKLGHDLAAVGWAVQRGLHFCLQGHSLPCRQLRAWLLLPGLPMCAASTGTAASPFTTASACSLSLSDQRVSRGLCACGWVCLPACAAASSLPADARLPAQPPDSLFTRLRLTSPVACAHGCPTRTILPPPPQPPSPPLQMARCWTPLSWRTAARR